jgi:hypothetical protein
MEAPNDFGYMSLKLRVPVSPIDLAFQGFFPFVLLLEKRFEDNLKLTSEV